jgi:amphi-Trp domain-containing protein
MAKKQKLFRQKERKSSDQVAQFLRELAQKVEEGRVILKGVAGEREIYIPHVLALKVKASKKTKPPKGTTHKLTIQLSWNDGDHQGGHLELG